MATCLPENTHSKTCMFVLFAIFTNTVWVQPAASEDVIGLYMLQNVEQCRKLCWYRKVCNTYSYFTTPALSTSVASSSQCVLHKGLDTLEAATTNSHTPNDGFWWTQKPASGLYVHNGCNARPCTEREVCVPTSSASASHTCLPLPSQCGLTEAVPHGDAKVNGDSHGDIAHVTCDEGFVASPRDVRMELACLESSRWTTFVGTCKQYEFSQDRLQNSSYILPWKLTQNSEFCLEGIISSHGRMLIHLHSSPNDSILVRILFLYFEPPNENGVFMRVHEKGVKLRRKVRLGSNHLVPGISFSVTVRLLRTTMQLVLNAAHTYDLPLDLVQLHNGSQYDVGKTRTVGFVGAMDTTYINLIAGCH